MKTDYFNFNSLIILVFVAVCFKNIQSVNGGKNVDEPKPLHLQYHPETAIEVPFDTLFKSIEIVNLENIKGSKLISPEPLEIRRLDSSLIVCDLRDYLVFDLKGKFIKRIGTAGEGPNSNISLRFFYANNDYILSVCGTKWIKFGLNGPVIGKGRLGYKVYPFSFMPLDDSTWLFHAPYINVQSDTLRLWTTDKNFRIIKQYLFYTKDSPHGGSGFFKYLFQSGNDVYLADRVVDTVYKFTKEKVIPIYVFDYKPYTYKNWIDMAPLKRNEISSEFTVVSKNAVIREISSPDQTYLIYHNKVTKKTVTIKKITQGLDLKRVARLVGSDKDGRLYWCLKDRNDFLEKNQLDKYGFTNLLRQQNNQSNPFIIMTALR